MTLLAIQDYFRALAAAHPDVHDYVLGDSEAILSRDRSHLRYPLLWLETPEVQWAYRPAPASRRYTLSFVVLMHSAMDVPEREQYALHRTLEITHELLAQLSQDIADGEAAMGLVSWGGPAASMPVLGYGVDNDHGWRTTIELSAPALNCVDCPGLLAGAPAPALQLAFTVANTGTAPAFHVAVTVQPPSADVWTYNWVWYIDGGPMQLTAPSGAIGVGAVLYIALTATRGSTMLYASAIVPAGRPCVASVPGVYPPAQVL